MLLIEETVPRSPKADCGDFSVARATAWLCSHFCLTSWDRLLLTSHLAVLAVLMALDKLPLEADHRIAAGHQSDTGWQGFRSQSRGLLVTKGELDAPIRHSSPRPGRVCAMWQELLVSVSSELKKDFSKENGRAFPRAAPAVFLG